MYEEYRNSSPSPNPAVNMKEMVGIKIKCLGTCDRHAVMLEQSGLVVRTCKMHASPRRNGTMREVCVGVLNGVSTLWVKFDKRALQACSFAQRRMLFQSHLTWIYHRGFGFSFNHSNSLTTVCQTFMKIFLHYKWSIESCLSFCFFPSIFEERIAVYRLHPKSTPL